MKLLVSAVLAASAIAAAPAYAASEKDLATSKGCLACHGIDNKIVGPGYKEIAAKYKGQKDAEAKLIEKVKKGASGTWGPAAMPPQSPASSDADIKTLVQWILKM
ncbi:MAG: c-type cytochrome [Rhodocyclaceae bacterium]|nr:c-type cytochrome [Rhodocyclaceae bacterium]MBX3668716.1 c-type cytochrome [Rhodocyclaceae bacterium]